MCKHLVTFKHQNSELTVVPSIHFNHLFASEVNRICSHTNTRPNAIAVELGEKTATAASNWLKELMINQKDKKSLPVMLGLMKRNRLIHASYKKKAFLLQKKLKCDLDEMTPDILYHELGFSGKAILYLSPTDSIVEAMRCAVELDLPLFGVDLEEMANSDFKPVMIQDPVGGKLNLKTYIMRNAAYAKKQRDDGIDGRREIAMAARIKTLLGKYKKVLLVCGMAHWIDISQLLEDSSIKPALIYAQQRQETKKNFTRVIVHPLIAMQYMDRFPALVENYEKSRQPACEFTHPDTAVRNLEPLKIFKNCLSKTYNTYFCDKTKEMNKDQRNLDLEILRDFEGYLENLCILSHRAVPDLPMAIKTAQEIMSKQFVKYLSNTLMEYSWATPEDYPEYPLLSPPPGRGYDSGCGTLIKNNVENNHKYFYMKPIFSSHRYSGKLEIEYEWNPTKKTEQYETDGISKHTYLPWDYLITALSLKAIGQSVKKHIRHKTEVFNGSLMGGIDIKSSLKSYSQGREVPYVKDIKEKNISYVSRTRDGFPIVWIFNTLNRDDSDWNVLIEPSSYMLKYVHDKNRMESVIRKRGHEMVALISYGRKGINSQASQVNSNIYTDCFDGVLLYQPICWTNQQFAYWAELTGYNRNPFCGNSYLGKSCANNLIPNFEKEHGINISEIDWPTVLILFAIPFAKDVVTVVTPNNYRIDRIVFEKAKKYGVEVLSAPLNSFSKKELDRISLCHMVPAITHDPKCIYSKSIEEAIGEVQTQNRDLVPEKWLNFGC